MAGDNSVSRRSVLAMAAPAPLASLMAQSKACPVVLQLYSVRDELTRDLTGTIRDVAKMGNEGVEFFAP
jgi:hypothetical protein